MRQEETIVVGRLRTPSTTVWIRYYNDTEWRASPHTIAVDKLVPQISWACLIIQGPLLIEVRTPGYYTVRQLFITNAGLVLDDDGKPIPSVAQLSFKMVQRIREVTDYTFDQATNLRNIVNHEYSLQICWFAADLMKRSGYRFSEAQSCLELLWAYSPEQMQLVLLPQFHVLAVEDPSTAK